MKQLELLIRYNNEFLKVIFETINDDKQEINYETKIPLGLYNSIIEKAKSIQVLYENKHYAGIETICRSIFEQITILNFILEKDTPKRAKAYYLSNIVRNIEFAEETTKKENYNNLINSFDLKGSIKILDQYKKEEHLDLLSEFQELTGAKKSHHWFKVAENQLNNFKDLCKYMGDRTYAEYLVIYPTYSSEVHGKDIKSYYIDNENEFSLTYKGEQSTALIFTNKILQDIPEKLSVYFNLKIKQQSLYMEYVTQLLDIQYIK